MASSLTRPGRPLAPVQAGASSGGMARKRKAAPDDGDDSDISVIAAAAKKAKAQPAGALSDLEVIAAAAEKAELAKPDDAPADVDTIADAAEEANQTKLDALREELVAKGVAAMRATALKSRTGKKNSAWFCLSGSTTLETFQELLGGRGGHATSNHVTLTADDLAALLICPPDSSECLWDGPVRIPAEELNSVYEDQRSEVYFTKADVVSAEMRWTTDRGGTLKMMMTSVRSERTTVAGINVIDDAIAALQE